MKDKLEILLQHITGFDAPDLDKILACFEFKSVNRNTFLLREGEVCKAFYYLHSGSIRTYFIDRAGHEKTRYVMLDCTIGTALTSFINQQPSSEFIEVLEDSQLLSISHHDFYRLINEIAQWKHFYQKILEMAYTYQNKKIEALITCTARQRYDELMQENPLLIQRLSNKVLASFIDVREETLSRLKSKN